MRFSRPALAAMINGVDNRKRRRAAAMGGGYPYLSSTSVPSTAPSGTTIGTLVVPPRSYPYVAPNTISTDAVSGSTIGTIRTS